MSDRYCICVRVDDDFAEQTPTCLLRKAIATTLQHYDVAPDIGVTLLVTHDDDVRKLNQRYRGVDSVTDVLSFPAGADDSAAVPPGVEEAPYLGDIIVAYPYTARQAGQDSHPLADVLVLLAVHGTLHLLGFDHDNADNQTQMWQAQETILKQLDVSTTVIPPMYDYGGDDSE
jgi:probable rRNA maturation factor